MKRILIDKLPIEPRWLIRMGTRAGNPLAIACGYLALWFGSTAFLFFAGLGIAEPYGSVDAVFYDAPASLARVLAIDALLAVIMAAPFAAMTFLPGWTRQVRVLAIGACVLLPLWIAWCFCSFCEGAGSPDFILGVRPEWLQWRGWDVLALPIWPLLGVLYLLWAAWLARPAGPTDNVATA